MNLLCVSNQILFAFLTGDGNQVTLVQMSACVKQREQKVLHYEDMSLLLVRLDLSFNVIHFL